MSEVFWSRQKVRVWKSLLMFRVSPALADIPELMEQLRWNYQYWKEQEDPHTHQEEQEEKEEGEEGGEQEEKEQEEEKVEDDGEETVTS